MSIQTSDGLKRTVNIDFPRSGNSLAKPILSDCFGSRFHFCEWYEQPQLRPDICPQTNFTKTHDFDLAWPITDTCNYLVLIRHPLHAVASWADLYSESKETGVEWRLDFWLAFTKKWLLQPIPNRLIVMYERMIAEPSAVFSEIIRFMDCTTDEEPYKRLKTSIAKRRIAPRQDHAQSWLHYP